jgi:hypothetical protein
VVKEEVMLAVDVGGGFGHDVGDFKNAWTKTGAAADKFTTFMDELKADGVDGALVFGDKIEVFPYCGDQT